MWLTHSASGWCHLNLPFSFWALLVWLSCLTLFVQLLSCQLVYETNQSDKYSQCVRRLFHSLRMWKIIRKTEVWLKAFWIKIWPEAYGSLPDRWMYDNLLHLRLVTFSVCSFPYPFISSHRSAPQITLVFWNNLCFIFMTSNKSLSCLLVLRFLNAEAFLAHVSNLSVSA